MINQPLTLPNGVVIKNRLVKSAMSEALGDARNNTTPAHIGLFEKWSTGGAGMLITGNTPVDRLHLEHAANFVLDDDSDLPAVRRLAAAAKSGGSLALVQLGHSGRQTPEAINARPLSVSDRRLDLPGYGEPRAATEEELQTVIARFARSAVLAMESGFDGVEIHSAHGYLLSSSLSLRINTRTDRWGGSLENRARLVLSVVRAVRAAIGPKAVVAVKLNSSDFQKGGFTHDESMAVAVMLQEEGIDFLEISGGNFETPKAYQHISKKESTREREAWFLDYAAAIKAGVKIPIMVTGGFRSLGVMNAALADKALDLIGMGRPFIIDPEFPKKLLSGSVDMAPAPERDFPPADELPAGAALGWFCDQLTHRGMTGDTDLRVPIIAGNERYQERIRSATEQWLKTREKN